jgi:hypothetical protein
MPKIESEEGFLNLVIVGNLIELADIINRKSYTHTISAEIREEQNIARCRYRRFQIWFAEHFVVFMEDHWISPSYIFQRSLLELSAAIVGYKWDKDGVVKAPAHCTAKAVESAVCRHFQNDWPDLVPKLNELLQTPPSEFFWTGPKIHIQTRPVEPISPILVECLDFPPHPILLVNANPGEGEVQDDTDAREKAKDNEHDNGMGTEGEEEADPSRKVGNSVDAGGEDVASEEDQHPPAMVACSNEMAVDAVREEDPPVPVGNSADVAEEDVGQDIAMAGLDEEDVEEEEVQGEGEEVEEVEEGEVQEDEK